MALDPGLKSPDRRLLETVNLVFSFGGVFLDERHLGNVKRARKPVNKFYDLWTLSHLLVYHSIEVAQHIDQRDPLGSFFESQGSYKKNL